MKDLQKVHLKLVLTWTQKQVKKNQVVKVVKGQKKNKFLKSLIKISRIKKRKALVLQAIKS